MSPDIANAPHRHHAAHRYPTVCAPTLLTAFSNAINPTDGRAQLAEKALIAPGVKV